jgi:hypothetical protein
VFDRYVKSYKDGEFKVTHEARSGDHIETDTYVYGGVDFSEIKMRDVDVGEFQSRWPNRSATITTALHHPTTEQHGNNIWLGGLVAAPGSAPINDVPPSLDDGGGDCYDENGDDNCDGDVSAAGGGDGGGGGGVQWILLVGLPSLLVGGTGVWLILHRRRRVAPQEGITETWVPKKPTDNSWYDA